MQMQIWNCSGGSGDDPPRWSSLSVYTQYVMQTGSVGPDCMTGRLAHPVEVQRWWSHADIWNQIASLPPSPPRRHLIREPFALSADTIPFIPDEVLDEVDVVLVDGRTTGGRVADPGTLAYIVTSTASVRRLIQAAHPASQTVDAMLWSLGQTGRLRVMRQNLPRGQRPTWPMRSWQDTLHVARDGGTLRWFPDVSVASVLWWMLLVVLIGAAVALHHQRRRRKDNNNNGSTSSSP